MKTTTTTKKSPKRPQSSRKFVRTVIRFEVLSEGPLGTSDLADIAAACEIGDCVGRTLNESSDELTGKQAARALYVAGSEPGFFQLDDKGREADGGDDVRNDSL